MVTHVSDLLAILVSPQRPMMSGSFLIVAVTAKRKWMSPAVSCPVSKGGGGRREGTYFE